MRDVYEDSGVSVVPVRLLLQDRILESKAITGRQTLAVTDFNREFDSAQT